MSDLIPLIDHLRRGQDLGTEQVETAASLLASESEPDDGKAGFLTALSEKGETAEEVAAFAAAFRGRARDPGVSELAPRAIDVCGTGGDRSGTFNISTLTAFVTAAAGVPVFKHGNRSITSKCGSADILAALGVPLEATAEQVRRGLDEVNFAFFFAPAYHPAFKAIVPVRKALAAEGRRTVFNILGPLINPGRPAHQLLGVFSAEWVERLADALDRLGLAAGFVVHGERADGGVDELTVATVNQVAGFGRLSEVRGAWKAEDFGLKSAPWEDLAGGDLEANLALLDSILEGKAPRGLIDSVVWNSAAALHVAGVAGDVGSGIAVARDLLLGGRTRALIRRLPEVFA